MEGVFVIQAHRSVGSVSPCRRPGCVFSIYFLTRSPSMSAPPRRCWVGNAASSVCAVGQRTHPAEVQSEPHLPSDVVLGQLVTERIGLENGIVLSFSS